MKLQLILRAQTEPTTEEIVMDLEATWKSRPIEIMAALEKACVRLLQRVACSPEVQVAVAARRRVLDPTGWRAKKPGGAE